MKRIILLAILPLLLFLTGCQTSMLVEEANASKLAPLLIDYANLHGYKVLYKNDKTHAYRIYLGQVYIPARTSSLQESITKIDTADVDYALTIHEEKAYQTIKERDQYVDLIVMVRLFSQGDDIKVVIDSDDTYYQQPTSSQGSKLKRYLENSGYRVSLL